MIEQKEYSNHEKKLIGEQVLNVGIENISEKFPDFKRKVETVLSNPEPTLIYKIHIWPLRDIFCRLQNISIETLKANTSYRKLFIAIIVKLYYPAFITGYQKDIMDGLAHELSGALECKREWVSQQHDYVKDVLSNIDKYRRVYQADRMLIEDLSDKMGSEIMKGSINQNECRIAEMFSNTATEVNY